MPPSAGSLRSPRQLNSMMPSQSVSTDHQPPSNWLATNSHAMIAGHGNMLASAVMYHGSRVLPAGDSSRLSTSINIAPLVVPRRGPQVQGRYGPARDAAVAHVSTDRR